MPGPEVLEGAFHGENILLALESQKRVDVIKALVRNLVETGRIAQAQAATATRLVNEREALGSTAIGDGVALPHARVGFVEKGVGAFALLDDGSDFGALDGAPVHFVFLLLTPKDDDAAHIELMKAVTHFARDPIARKALRGCKTPDDVCGVFRDYA